MNNEEENTDQDYFTEAAEQLEQDLAPVVNWADLTSAGYDPAETWEKVLYWAKWWVDRFDIPNAVLPECWVHHGYLIERVTAMRDAWLLSYSPIASGVYPNDWLDHHDRAVEAMRSYVQRSGCFSKHNPEMSVSAFDPYDTFITVAAPSTMSPAVPAQPVAADHDGNDSGE